jgi:hypothetical protein
MEHVLFGLADADATDGMAGEIEPTEFLGAPDAQVVVDRALVDAEEVTTRGEEAAVLGELEHLLGPAIERVNTATSHKRGHTGGGHSSSTIAMSEPSASWMSKQSFTSRKSLLPSRWELKWMPSSVMVRGASRARPGSRCRSGSACPSA